MVRIHPGPLTKVKMQNEKGKSPVKNPKELSLKQRAYIYALKLIKFLDNVPNDTTGQTIKNQLIRSGTSIGANIIEAQAGSSRKDFANFYRHALKSANESKFWIGLLRDSNRANKDSANEVLKETEEIANILAASIITVTGKRSA